jgi:hypothetical protein
VTERGQSKPPSPELAQFITLVNEEQKLDDIASWVRDLSANGAASLSKKLKFETRKFLGPTIDLRQFRINCELLLTAKEVLSGLAARTDEGERQGLDGDGSGSLSIPTKVNLYVDHDGSIAASGTFLNAIRGAKADRIRKCEVCDHIFWAARTTSRCCDQRCRKVWNQRNSRKNRLYKLRISKTGR